MRNHSRRAFAAILPLLMFVTFINLIFARPLTSAERQRANGLYTVFVAPCCWRQSVAVHQSPEAGLVRREIDNRVAAGLTDAEIKSDLTREYGHGILLEPEGARALAAYAGPALATSAALLLAVLWIRHLARRPHPAEQPLVPVADYQFDPDDE